MSLTRWGSFRVTVLGADLSSVGADQEVPFQLQIGNDFSGSSIPFDSNGHYRAH